MPDLIAKTTAPMNNSELSPWASAREARRKTSLITPAATLVIGLVALFKEPKVIVGSLLTVALLGPVVISWLIYLNRRGSRKWPTAVPFSSLSSTDTSLVKFKLKADSMIMGHLSCEADTVVWTCSRKDWNLQLRIPARDFSAASATKVWGIVPNYYVNLPHAGGSIDLWTHYWPEVHGYITAGH